MRCGTVGTSIYQPHNLYDWATGIESFENSARNMLLQRQRTSTLNLATYGEFRTKGARLVLFVLAVGDGGGVVVAGCVWFGWLWLAPLTRAGSQRPFSETMSWWAVQYRATYEMDCFAKTYHDRHHYRVGYYSTVVLDIISSQKCPIRKLWLSFTNRPMWFPSDIKLRSDFLGVLPQSVKGRNRGAFSDMWDVFARSSICGCTKYHRRKNLPRVGVMTMSFRERPNS